MNMSSSLKRYAIILAAFLIGIGIGLTPAPAGLPQAGMHVLGIFACCLLLWLMVAIDWPSLVCVVAISFMGIVNFKKILSTSFGGETFVFLLCTFLCTYALAQTPFLKRCAIAFVTSDIAKKGPWYFAISFFAAVIVIGFFISPTVLFVVLLPMLEEIYAVLKLEKGNPIASMLMMGLVFCTSISSGMTPIAHVFSIMAIGFYQAATGISISYGSYMAFAIPVGIISVILMILMFKYVMRVDLSPLGRVDVSHLKESLEPISRREILSVLVFLSVIVAWVLPSLAESAMPSVAKFLKSYGTAMPPMVGAIVLSILATDNKPLLDFNGAMKNGIPWGSLIMTVGTLTLGMAMTNKDVGISNYLIHTLGPQLHAMNPMLIVFFLTLWAAIQTNLSSNMVTVTVVVAVAIPLTLATGGTVNSAAVVSIIGMMAAFAFATPPAMPHVAIAGGSGWTTVKELLKYGILEMFLAVLVTVIIGYPIATMFM